jgi:formylglycine-generating enzyme required for sulfatase activity
MKGKTRFPVILVWTFLILTLAALLPAGPRPAVAQNRNIGVGPAPGEDRPVEPAWLYVVGINEYKYVQKLQTPVMDAQAVRDLLLAKYQFDRSRLGERYNGQATRAQILDDLYRLAKNLSPKDSLFIYYAGHGYEDPTLNQGFWIPVDAQMGKIYSYISNADIRTILAGIPANHVWLVSDSCFSGSLLAERSLTGEIDERYYREKYKQKSRQVMTSGGKEPVADQSGSRDCLSHSVFACYFLKYLQNNNQRYLTPSELFSSVAPVISNNSGQTPVFGPLQSAGDEMGEFVLIARSTMSQPSPVALPAPTAPAQSPAPAYTGADTSNLQELEKRAGQREQDNKARQQQLGVERKKYAADLETYYQKVSSLETRAALTPAEKAAAFSDFLSKFPANHPDWGSNPRAPAAEQKKGHWEAEANKPKLVAGVGARTTAGLEYRPGGKKGGPMVAVSAGEFGMGCNERVDNQCENDEKPYHQVYLDAFYIDKFEVTQGEYDECVRAGQCKDNEKNSGFTGARQPVVGVDWNDAKNYCEWAGKRLPTEAEWEKAARGTDGRVYPWGNQTPSCSLTNLSECEGKTWEVGSNTAGASPYGALDLAGNVWEWVADWYDGNYYSSSPSRNPTGPASGSLRGLRGGSWYLAPEFVRASLRLRHLPDGRYHGYGFRCAQ